MENSLEKKDIETEPTNEWKIPNIQIVLLKKEKPINTEFVIKTESDEDESEFAVNVGISYEMYPKDDSKVETDEPIIKTESLDMIHEMAQDPLDVNNEIIVGVPTFNPGWEVKRSKEEDIFLTDEEQLHESKSNSLDQYSIKDKKILQGRNFICHICKKAFIHKYRLDRHLLIHIDERPYTCNICNKSFNQNADLNRHMLIHTGEKPHVCNVCKKVFNQKTVLNRHMLVHSGDKPFSCSECDKSFKHKNDLARHERGHTGYKAYSCELCSKEFIHKSNLTQHRNLHTGERPYTCGVCYRSFSQKAGLYSHKRNKKH